MKFEYTCYYPLTFQEQKREDVIGLKKHKGPYGKFSHTLKVVIDGKKQKFFVFPKDQYDAAVEGSALLIGLNGNRYGLAFFSNKWHFMDHSLGIGSIGNKLVPFRDCANNHYNFATALIMKPAPDFLSGNVEQNHVFFVADSFGPSALGAKRKNRIDLFVAEKTLKRGWVNYVDIFGIPTQTISGVKIPKESVEGAQICLNRLGFSDADAEPLKVDGAFGKKTKYACNRFVWFVLLENLETKFKKVFGVEVEQFEIEPNPRDPAFYFLVRHYVTKRGTSL